MDQVAENANPSSSKDPMPLVERIFEEIPDEYFTMEFQAVEATLLVCASASQTTVLMKN